MASNAINYAIHPDFSMWIGFAPGGRMLNKQSSEPIEKELSTTVVSEML